ncbi:hypothetical protein WG904_17210 [Pedobacter sp. Du54]|uniref:hypothetical protein n=1 Tax=Pedobacter anseongensis TaxID=3133439 RepID=UPI0030B35E6B
MKKLRITPLNVVTSLGLVFLALSFFSYNSGGLLIKVGMEPLYRIILGCLILVSIVTDLIFRFVFKDLKRVWFVELSFISLTIIIFLLLQK